MPRVLFRVLYFSDVTSAEEHTTHAARLCREGEIGKKIRACRGSFRCIKRPDPALVERCMRSERAARAERGEENSKAQKHRNTPGARNRGPRAPRARRARTPRTPSPSRRAQRTSARPLVVREPPPDRGRSEGAARARSDGRDGRRAREEETTAARANGPARLRRREPPTATHARRARRALVPRCPPRPRSARSGGRREGARRGRGRRPATGRAKSKRRRPPRRARTALLDCGGENHPRRPRPVSTPPFYSRSCATPSEDKNLTLGVLGIAVSRSHPPPCTRFRPAQTLAHNRSTNLDCRGRTRALLPLLSAAAGQPLKPRHQGTPDGRPVEKGWAWLVWSGARPAFWTDREGAKRGEAKGDDPGGP